MGKYYYTPFDTTDENERAAWNICKKWGAKFADSTCGMKYVATDTEIGKVYVTSNPEGGSITTKEDKKRTFLTPNTLARTLVDEGLKNVKCNISLLCCFGGGIQSTDLNAITAATSQGLTNTVLAHFLAKELGVLWGWTGQADAARVSGYVGATNSKGEKNAFEVDLTGGKQYAPAEDHKKWYDLNGIDSSQNEPDPDDATESMRGLEKIAAGDVLYIMAHGDWKHGGRFLPYPGGLLNATNEQVNRAARMRGEIDVVNNQPFAVKPLRENPPAQRWKESEAPPNGRFKACWVVGRIKNTMHAWYFDKQSCVTKTWDALNGVAVPTHLISLEKWFNEPENEGNDKKIVTTILILTRKTGNS